MKRVAFTFDALSLQTLQQMTAEGQSNSLADCVREPLQINRIMQDLARRGFSDVVVRQPSTGAERVVVIPRLHMLKRGEG